MSCTRGASCVAGPLPPLRALCPEAPLTPLSVSAEGGEGFQIHDAHYKEMGL